MTRTLSTYLDAVRFLAALTVVLCHFTFSKFTGGIVPFQGALAGAAVTVFFVLSGYVIAYVSQEKERTLTDFAISRCARIYSVAIPALLLTVAINMFMLSVGEDASIPMYQYRGMWKYLPVFLTFSTEILDFHIVVLTNGPFWSLSYEVWYYITFAAAFYLTGWRCIVALPLCLIILGVPALIYFPIWLIGCVVYHLHQRTSIPKAWARVIASSSIVGLLVLRVTGADDAMDEAVNVFLGGWPASHWHNSMHFSVQYVVGSLIAVNFYAIRYCDLRILTVPWIRTSITFAASFTFAIYLAHRPLMDFWALVIQHDPHSAFSAILLLTLVLGSVFVFGLVSEHRKREWRALFRWLFRQMGANVRQESRA